MAPTDTSKVLELFGNSTRRDHDWAQVVRQQRCPFANTKCFKVRKSDPDVSIGTCSVRYGKSGRNVIICPNRLLERRQVFTDCLHLLTRHNPRGRESFQRLPPPLILSPFNSLEKVAGLD